MEDNVINIKFPFLNVFTLVFASKADVIADEYNLMIPKISKSIIIKL
jgi:hypothetical protein